MVKLAVQRVPRHEDLVHQRDRQRLRGDRRRRHRGRARAWASTTASGRSSCRRASASADRASPRTSPRSSSSPATRGYHFQLLNAVIEVNELQKRRVIGKLQKHLGTLVGKRDRAARPGVQAEHRRHARGDARSCSARGCRPRARTVAAYDPVAEDEARQLMPGVEFADDALDCVARRRRRRARHRVGGVQASSTSGTVAAAHARRRPHRRAQRARSRRRPRRRPASTRASAAGGLSGRPCRR